LIWQKDVAISSAVAGTEEHQHNNLSGVEDEDKLLHAFLNAQHRLESLSLTPVWWMRLLGFH
jgi:hypothetical protein